MEVHGGSAAEAFDAEPMSTDDIVWTDSELPGSEEMRPVILDDVPAADALDQARTVPLDDDR
jgi:hypothetical protein